MSPPLHHSRTWAPVDERPEDEQARASRPPRARSPTRCSPLEAVRAKEIPAIPEALVNGPALLRLHTVQEDSAEVAVTPEVASVLPAISQLRIGRLVPADSPASAEPCALRIGVVSVSAAVAAAGTHNVIVGLCHLLRQPDFAGSRLYGIRSFTKDNEFEITWDCCSLFLNQPGSDLLPTMPLAIVTERMMMQMRKLCERQHLDGLVFLCSAGELAHVASIANYFAREGLRPAIVAVPHSVSGWVRLPGWIQTNLGFDSACSVLAEVAGNISLSRQSLNLAIYHFVACGSKTLTLEVAMQIHPTLCFIGEDVAQRGLTLQQVVDQICDVIVDRHWDHGLHSGVVMVSDDFFEQLPEMRRLREALHALRLEKPADIRSEESAKQMLPADLGEFFGMLPPDVCHALVFRNGVDGLPQVKQHEAERELGTLVARCLAHRAAAGERSVRNFLQQPHSLRYIALCPMPTALDCALGFALGQIAGVLVGQGANGYVANVSNAGEPAARWSPCAVPLTRLLVPGAGEQGLVVRRRNLGPEDKLARLWTRVRHQWHFSQSYREPGPVQFWGPGGSRPLSWATYTLRAECMAEEELAREMEDAEPAKAYVVPLDLPFRLERRREGLLSPFQKWRLTYQPTLPLVLRGFFQIAEEDHKGRVCADFDLVRACLPNLWRTDHLKAVRVKPVKVPTVSVLHMLPSMATFSGLYRDDSAAGSSNSLYNEGSLRNLESPTVAKTPTIEASPRLVTGGEQGELGPDFVNLDVKRPRHRVGIALVGRSGPGVNNVVQGLLDYLRTTGGTVVCIAMGVAGLVAGHAFDLTEEMLAPHRNQGGCDLLGQSQPEDLLTLGENLAACASTARKLQLDGLVIWGGRNGHSWTARLAEYFAEHQVPTCVVGVPASVQSDLPLIEQTLGYDSVCKLYSSIVGNLATQAASSGKMWVFVRIPGRSISHMAAEVALETHPHVVLMLKETAGEPLGLPEVTQKICDVIESRCREEKNWGVVLIPDQLLGNVREMKQLFEEVEQIRRAFPQALEGLETGVGRDFGPILPFLPPLSRALFQSFPERIRAQICNVVNMAARDSKATDTVSRTRQMNLAHVETEVIVQTLVEYELTRRVVLGTYKGPFQVITYSLPYHGRAAMPTNFDCDLGYTIGFTAGIFVEACLTGLLVDVTKLKEDIENWEVGGTPLSSLLTFQDPPCNGRPATYEIKPRSRLLYDLNENKIAEQCGQTLVNPGPAQFDGPCAGSKTATLCMPQMQRVPQMAKTERLIAELKAKASAGCPPEVLQAVKMLLQGGADLLRQL